MRQGALAVLVFLAIFATVFFLADGPGVLAGRKSRLAAGEQSADSSSPAPAAAGTAPPNAKASGVQAGADRAATAGRLRAKARELLNMLRSKAPREDVRRALEELKASAHDADPTDASETLIGLLRSGEDAPTGLGFFVGTEGVMSETPTYRTALLDLLGQTDPVLSSEYAREVMDTTNSSDEFALALRNLAWANHDSVLDEELRTRLQQMLARPDWQQDPTKGYLEAFDVAVATKSAPEMFALIQAEGGSAESPASRAAFVALDRMMLADPGAVLGPLGADPSLLAGSPFHRASLVSRADVRDASQAQFLEHYLCDPSVSPREIDYFARIFPNGNRFSSNRLVTDQEEGGSIDQVAAGDRATLDTVRSWMSRPEFSARQEALSRIAARLQGFLRPAQTR